MRQMIILLLFLLFISCQQNNSPINKLDSIESNLSIKADIIRGFDSIYSNNNDTLKTQTYDVKLSVTNISDQPITCWTMACSWSDNWLISKDNYYIIGTTQCDSNFPLISRINPKESLTYNTLVCPTKNNPSYMNQNNIKFGFIYIDTILCKKMRDFDNFIGDRSKQNVIWSNSVNIK